MGIDDANDDDDDYDNFSNIPDETALECLCNADLLRRAFGISGPPFEFIVVCKEYEFLRKFLGQEEGTYIVTGQAGTGS